MPDRTTGRIAGRFTGFIARRIVRVEPRLRLRASIVGLPVDLPWKNSWTSAEHAGDTTGKGMPGPDDRSGPGGAGAPRSGDPHRADRRWSMRP